MAIIVSWQKEVSFRPKGLEVDPKGEGSGLVDTYVDIDYIDRDDQVRVVGKLEDGIDLLVSRPAGSRRLMTFVACPGWRIFRVMDLPGKGESVVPFEPDVFFDDGWCEMLTLTVDAEDKSVTKLMVDPRQKFDLTLLMLKNEDFDPRTGKILDPSKLKQTVTISSSGI